MKEIKKLELIGYLQLYIKLWKVDEPEVAFTLRWIRTSPFLLMKKP